MRATEDVKRADSNNKAGVNDNMTDEGIGLLVMDGTLVS
jgi:hypothetical protein